MKLKRIKGLKLYIQSVCEFSSASISFHSFPGFSVDSSTLLVVILCAMYE